MSIINVTNVTVLENPAKFTAPFQFQITFDCAAPGIKGELEWKLVYVGSAEDEKYDQELDCVLVGPVAIGKNKFVFQAPAPDPAKIPNKDLLEVTVILLTCSYNDAEFIRIGTSRAHILSSSHSLRSIRSNPIRSDPIRSGPDLMC